jgi:Uma2 family endonuclease
VRLEPKHLREHLEPSGAVRTRSMEPTAMATSPQIREGLTLEEFLRLPDEKPYREYIDGRIEVKVSPQKKHGLIEFRLVERINRFAMSIGLGLAFPELRCTFAGRSIVPDVVFLLKEHIEIDDQGEPVDVTSRPPDLHVEIISPDQTVKKSQGKLIHSTSHGTQLGWLIHPYKRTIDVYRPGRPAERVAPEGVLEGEPVLPGFRLPAAEVFGWLKLNF